MNEENAVPCPVVGCKGNIAMRHVGDLSALGCDGQGRHGDATVIAMWRAQDKTSDASFEFEQDERIRRIDPAAWCRDKLAEAREEADERVTVLDQESDIRLPPFPHGFVGDVPLLRHLNGMVTLSGKASAGKSWMALGASLNAANEGWDVHYIAAEGSDVIIRRARNSQRDRKNWTIHGIEPGVTVTDLMDAITSWIVRPRTLLVIDSISTLQGLMKQIDGQKGWEAQSKLEMFLMRIRSLTRGYVAIINLSEANAAGETKGRSLDHRSDIAINFISCDAEREVKSVVIVKSWEGHTGSLGFGRIDASVPGIMLSDDPPGSGEDQSQDHW